jgi:hypothetical protein
MLAIAPACEQARGGGPPALLLLPQAGAEHLEAKRIRKMYDFPADFDPSSLVGHAVELVSFSGSAVIVAFDKDTRISIFGSYTHGQELAHADQAQVPPKESRLMRLVGATITVAAVENDSTLALRFSNGDTLGCVADSSHYECFAIETPTKFIVV